MTMKKALILFILCGVLTFNLYKTFNFLWADINIIKNFPRLSYDEKMRAKWGSYYDFMVFVKNNTPPNAVILIPPIHPPWAASGNKFLSYYFLYPRRLINGEINRAPPDFAKFTHFLIVWKDFEEKGLENLYGWPKFEVLAKEIIYMATESADVGEVRKGYYLPKDKMSIGRYGLIKL